MEEINTDSGGRSGTPDLVRPPDSTSLHIVRCPECRGAGVVLADSNCGPIQAPRACLTCAGDRTVEVYWASVGQEPQPTHLWRVGGTPAEALCPHDPVPLDQLTPPSGAPCLACITRLSELTSL